MKIKLLALLGVAFMAKLCLGQSDEQNLQKYWKFRNSFVERYIKIGREIGESQPAGVIKPIECQDNLDPSIDGTPYYTTEYGEMHWGDGTIRHGHYLVLLATEYALQKKYSLDTIGVLNELYYALTTINRLDRFAEQTLDDIYNIPSYYGDLTNGFYLREDITEDFVLNWEDEPMRFRCTNSSNYFNNNAAKINNPYDQANTVKPEGSNYQNVPSLDQMTSLMVGLSMVHKLVPNVAVQPTEEDEVMFILDEVAEIVHRMVMFGKERNWYLLDVNGWPVANGGGDLILAAQPLSIAASRITGNPLHTYMNGLIFRRPLYYFGNINAVQHCITGYGVSDIVAIQEYTDILTSGVSFDTPNAKALLREATADLQSAVENALDEGTFQKNLSYNSKEVIAGYIGALNTLTPAKITDNYKEAFYLELNKVHLFRALNLPEQAMDLLEGLEYCGLDSSEQVTVNHWKTMVERDITISTLGMNYLDQENASAAMGYLTPKDQGVDQYYFGANIKSLNSYTFPECRISPARTDASKGYLVYPNPSSDQVHFAFDLNENSTYTLVVSTIDGKEMSRQHYKGELPAFDQNVAQWEPGTYLFRLTRGNHAIASGNFVVK